MASQHLTWHVMMYTTGLQANEPDNDMQAPHHIARCDHTIGASLMHQYPSRSTRESGIRTRDIRRQHKYSWPRASWAFSIELHSCMRRALGGWRGDRTRYGTRRLGSTYSYMSIHEYMYMYEYDLTDGNTIRGQTCRDPAQTRGRLRTCS